MRKQNLMMFIKTYFDSFNFIYIQTVVISLKKNRKIIELAPASLSFSLFKKNIESLVYKFSSKQKEMLWVPEVGKS